MAKKRTQAVPVNVALSAKSGTAAKRSKSRSADAPEIDPPTVQIADGNRIVFDLERPGIGKTTTDVYAPEITTDGSVDVGQRPYYWWRHSDDRIHICTLRPVDVTPSDNAFRGYAAGKLKITIRSSGTGVAKDESWEYPVSISE